MKTKRMLINATVTIRKRIEGKGFTVPEGADPETEGVKEVLKTLGLNDQCDEFTMTVHGIEEAE